MPSQLREWLWQTAGKWQKEKLCLSCELSLQGTREVNTSVNHKTWGTSTQKHHLKRPFNAEDMSNWGRLQCTWQQKLALQSCDISIDNSCFVHTYMYHWTSDGCGGKNKKLISQEDYLVLCLISLYATFIFLVQWYFSVFITIQLKRLKNFLVCKDLQYITDDHNEMEH